MRWKGSCRVGRAGPISPNSKVQEDKERMVEHPLRALRKISGSPDGIQVFIYKEADRIRLPLNGKNVKVIGKSMSGDKGVRGTDPIVSRVAGTVDSTVNCWSFFVLHDVNLTASGPTNRSYVTAKQPESGPEPRTLGNLDARFETAILLGE